MSRSIQVTLAVVCLSFSAKAYDSQLEHGTLQVVTNYWDTGADQLQVGVTTDSNQLEINGAGSVDTEYVLVGADSDQNEITVSGGSLYAYDGAVIGDRGGHNQLMVENSGNVDVDHLVVGRSSEGNTVLISGNGSSVYSDNEVYIGEYQGGNRLLIEDGGVLDSFGGSLGEEAGSDGNVVVVQDEGSGWISGFGGEFAPLNEGPAPEFGPATMLYVGNGGRANVLNVYTGGVVIADSVIVGHQISSSSNQVNVAGAGALLLAEQGLAVGLEGDANSLMVLDGAVAASGGGAIGVYSDYNRAAVSGDGSTWFIDEELVVGVEGKYNELVIQDGASVEAGELVIGDEAGADMNRVVVSDAHLLTDGDLLVGHLGGESLLVITNGSLVESSSSMIGAGSDDNRVMIDNSVWDAGELSLGGYRAETWMDGGTGNRLSISGESVVAATSVHNRNESLIEVDAGSILSADTYYQDASSVLFMGISTNAAGEPVSALLDVSNSAEFENGATLAIGSEVGALEFDTVYSNRLVASDMLIVGGTTNAATIDLQQLNLYGSLVKGAFYENDQDLMVQFGRVRLADSAGFDPNSRMARVANEVDIMGLDLSPLTLRQLSILDGMTSEEQYAELTQVYAEGVPSYQHSKILDNQGDMLRGRIANKRSEDHAPVGANGPDGDDSAAQLWIKGFGGEFRYSEQSGFSAYDLNTFGTMIGYDRTYGDWMLGLAGGYGRTSIDQDNNDTSDADSGIGTLYASWNPEAWFADVYVSYARSSIETESGVVTGNGAAFDADMYQLYFGVGRSMKRGEVVSFIPEAGLISTFYDQEGYTEKAEGSEPKTVDPYDRWSVRSMVGATLEWNKPQEKVVIVPALRAFWMYEFNADTDELDYTLINGGEQQTFFIPGATENMFLFGVGIRTLFENGFGFGIDADAYAGNDVSGMTFNGRLLYQF